MINARAETARERPAFRDLVEKAGRRCLVLADGWYEWQGPRGPVTAAPVANPAVNSVRNDGPECLEPELTLVQRAP
jgi:putative SOS response-associated peptidase YedK